MKKFNTTKLFYGEYLYKLVWSSPCAPYFRGNDLSYVQSMIEDHYSQANRDNKATIRTWLGITSIDLDHIHQLKSIHTALSNQKYKLRVEGQGLSIYSTSKEWLHELALDIHAKEWWEPNSMLESNVIIMGPKMKGWEYRITFGTTIPDAFYNWIENNWDNVKIGKCAKRYIAKKSRYLNGYYFYVRNQKMLTVLSLVLGQGIQRIDRIDSTD